MISEMRADAKVQCRKLIELLRNRQEQGKSIGQTWRSKVKSHEASSILLEINRIAKWTQGDTSEEIVALRAIKQATKEGYSDFASWTSVGDRVIDEIYLMLEKACN